MTRSFSKTSATPSERLRSSPAFATVAILSLALGIGANTAIFSLIDSVMLKTLPVSHPEQLLQITTVLYQRLLLEPLWETLRDRQGVFLSVFAFSLNRYNLSQGRGSTLRTREPRQRAVL